MLDDILLVLDRSPVIRSTEIVENIPYGKTAIRLKLRSVVTDELSFQVWINHSDACTRYAFQLFHQGQTLLRWDNAPHHPELAVNFPHHFHDEYGQLHSSELVGIPPVDLVGVLEAIGTFLRQADG